MHAHDPGTHPDLHEHQHSLCVPDLRHVHVHVHVRVHVHVHVKLGGSCSSFDNWFGIGICAKQPICHFHWTLHDAMASRVCKTHLQLDSAFPVDEVQAADISQCQALSCSSLRLTLHGAVILHHIKTPSQ